MLTVEYSDRDFDERAWSAIDRGEPVEVVVRGWRVPILRRSMSLCEKLFGRERRAGRHASAEILGMVLYGWFSPWLFGVYNHANIAGMTGQWRETGGTIVVSFRPPAPGP